MPDVDNDHDRETDEWIVPADLRPDPTPTLRRDGGEKPEETR